ncbi:H - or Na -translocating F-type, V-type and A-type ATPase (F-ATPase) [Phytophthora megakarya]|uniref:H-or Na-translocating F-type, V-type and A-type ATPase (F-ATPase) n=1 Tax=Phytophthora megakarya TaxID=4795 RepID=A0A225X3G5_9STRA|nr:H - or Na -translocating F-type, V-type and A-type ATPase (F-ATPase) [Phytophthora megakarya]
MASKGTSLWRMAGVSYLQYANQSAGVLRAALKEPVKSTVQARSNVEFAGFKWANGERGERINVDSIKTIAEAFKKA